MGKAVRLEHLLRTVQRRQRPAAAREGLDKGKDKNRARLQALDRALREGRCALVYFTSVRLPVMLLSVSYLRATSLYLQDKID